LNPFDLRAALLAKHAQHVVLIHFPIALFIAGVIFDFLAQGAKRRALAAVAYYNLLGAAISAVPVVVTSPVRRPATRPSMTASASSSLSMSGGIR